MTRHNLGWPGLSLRSPGLAKRRGFEDSAPATQNEGFRLRIHSAQYSVLSTQYSVLRRLPLFLLIITIAFAALVPVPASDDPPKADASPIGPTQDIVYFAPTRPILIRLHLEVDGKAFDDAWDEYIAALFKFLDRDGDGLLSAAEAARAPMPQELLQLMGGNLFLQVNQMVNATEENKPTFETDEDGKVTVDALARFYRKNGAGPVQVTNYPPQTVAADALTDALFELLDTNRDGKLSKEELAAAEKRVLKLDANEDDLVSTQELIPTFADLSPVCQPSIRGGGSLRKLLGVQG